MYRTANRIRFPQGLFQELRNRLLQDPSQEAFALLFGQRHTIGDDTLIKVVATHYPSADDYESQGLAHLRLKREYVYAKMVEMQQRGDVDTLIDVHTHPFCPKGVAFSGVDDRDEKNFHGWLDDTLDNIHYASIVLSQSDYAARLWERKNGKSTARSAQIKTQTAVENWPSAKETEYARTPKEMVELQTGFLARSALALGLDTLRRVMDDQTITIIGVGGLGSVIAENLIHSGFQSIHLIDPDCVEITNLNRIVGAYYSDAEQNRLKVEVVAQHLQRINPKAQIGAHPVGIEDESVLPILLHSDWLVIATDNHFSRYKAQELALRFGIPLISTGVNISVEDEQITDMSGEVIIARSGDGLCLHCLGRINPTQIAAEQHRGQFIGNELVRRGYVSGQDVKEPAVKTLNAIVGAMAVDVLLNQYTQRQAHVPVWVYENNGWPCFYPDDGSVLARQKNCFHCN